MFPDFCFSESKLANGFHCVKVHSCVFYCMLCFSLLAFRVLKKNYVRGVLIKSRLLIPLFNKLVNQIKN